MIRRISTKWVLTVLAAVVLPFLAFTWYVDSQVAKWNLEDVSYDLLSISGEMAERLDNEIREREFDVELWTTTSPMTEWAVGDYGGDEVTFRRQLEAGFDHFVRRSPYYDLILAVNDKGQLV